MPAKPLKKSFPAVPPTREEINEFCNAGKLGTFEILDRYLDRFGAAIIDQRDGGGDTALTWSAWAGKKDVAEYLLDRGADINARGMHDKTALIWAAQGGKKDIVALLLKRGADTEIKDNTLNTAASIAEKNGQRECADMIKNWIDTQQRIATEKRREEEARQAAAERLQQLKKNVSPKLRLQPDKPKK